MFDLFSSVIPKNIIFLPLAAIGLYQIVHGVEDKVRKDIRDKRLTGWRAFAYIAINIIGVICFILCI